MRAATSYTTRSILSQQLGTLGNTRNVLPRPAERKFRFLSVVLSSASACCQDDKVLITVRYPYWLYHPRFMDYARGNRFEANAILTTIGITPLA